MEKRPIPLSLLSPGSTAKIRALCTEGSFRRRLLDLGFVDNTEIKVLQRSLSGDPVAFMIRGTVIALRSEEASKILVETP